VSSVLRPHQHSIGYTGDGFYRSKDPTNSIKVLKEKATKDKENNSLSLSFRLWIPQVRGQSHGFSFSIQQTKKTTKTTKCTHTQTIMYTKRYTQNKHSKSPSLQ